jgi:Skp family chaperone for outer membrane proteins
MSPVQLMRAFAIVVGLGLASCASTPPAAAPAAAATDAASAAPSDTKPAAGQRRYKWSKASEAEVTAVLDKKFEEAAKSYVKLKRDDQVMFCKRYREMGSAIRTLHCITEGELRKQVEDSDQVRDQLRHKMGKCDITVGCGAGG